MTTFHESGLIFQFDADWWVKSFDQHRFYQYINGFGLKGVDFVGIYQKTQLVFIEVKNYKLRWKPEGERLAELLGKNPEKIVQMFDQKTQDSLRILLLIHRYYKRRKRTGWYYWAMQQFYKLGWYSDFIFWLKAYELLNNCDCIQSILWMELDPTYPGLSTEETALAKVGIANEIRSLPYSQQVEMYLLGNGESLFGMEVREEKLIAVLLFGCQKQSARTTLMYLDHLILTQFKNYASQRVDFSPGLNCIVGRNGMGKTNLLDAIYYLCMTKSSFPISDRYVQQHDTEFFRLDGKFVDANQHWRIVVKCGKQQRKVVERNETPYKKLSEHIGRFPVVMIKPSDIEMVQDGSEVRRRMMDNILSQLDARYLQQLMRYNRLLKLRNAALKKGGSSLPALLDAYDHQMQVPARLIYERRLVFLEQMLPHFQEVYQAMTQGCEQVHLRYKSHLHDQSIQSILAGRREKDMLLQRTTEGIHRDDLVFTLDDHPLKRVASQGQVKTYVIALRLSLFFLLKQKKDQTPLLLLDDFFDKLDRIRVQNLMALLHEKSFGQVFVTDTDEVRLQQIAEALGADYQKFIIDQGTVWSPGMPKKNPS